MWRALAAAWGLSVVAMGVAPLTAAPLGAQMIGVPLVQSPFSNQAIILAVNGGFTDDGEDTLAGALGVKPPAGRGLAATIGGGYVWGGGGFATYGGRLSFLIPFGSAEQFAAAPFVGVGGTRADSARIPGIPDSLLAPVTYSLVNAPFGVSVGWRYSLGVDRAIAVHATPSWQVWRFTISGAGSTKNTYTRIGIGVDLSLNTRIGVSAAWEGGHTAKSGEIGPPQSIWGVGIAYVVK